MRTPLEQRIGRHATEWAIEHLQWEGWILVPPSEPGDFQMETLSELAERHHFCYETIRRKLAHPDCPYYEKKKGQMGRLIKLRSNYSLEAFLKTKKYWR